MTMSSLPQSIRKGISTRNSGSNCAIIAASEDFGTARTNRSDVSFTSQEGPSTRGGYSITTRDQSRG